MNVNTSEVVILTKTQMAGGVCVGAYDSDNERMIRLLDNRAGRLGTDAPYEVGQTYSMTYAVRYQLIAPHVEDVAVYEATNTGSLNSAELRDLALSLSSGTLKISELFQGKLSKNGSWFASQEDCPDFSVQIVKTRIPMFKDGPQHFKEVGLGASGRVKYVGSAPFARLPLIIATGTPVRYSLARFWDKGDGVMRAYLQLSAAYK